MMVAILSVAAVITGAAISNHAAAAPARVRPRFEIYGGGLLVTGLLLLGLGLRAVQG